MFADAEFENGVEAYVQNLAAKSATALSLTKQLLYHTDGMTLEQAPSRRASRLNRRVAYHGGC